ncbi:hypothetical protein JCM3770_000979 [Rhodotorula araucariae]
MHPLARWLAHQGVDVDPRIHLVARDDRSTAVDAREHIPSHTTLARIPVSLVLSHRSSALAHALVGSHDPLAACAPSLRLAVHVACELALGARSRWASYLTHCPAEPVRIALLWEGEAKRWTRGTELDTECRRVGVDQTILRQFYDSVALPLLSSLPSSSSSPATPPSLVTFQHAYTLVSSRAFQVSSFHPLALVPLADAFNHADPPHVHLASDAWVCPECGRLDACPHDDDERPASPVAARAGGTEETVDMVAERAIEAGEEVFNTYGSGLSNAHLVAAYGFLLEGNEHEVVSFERCPTLDMLLRYEGDEERVLGVDGRLEALERELDKLATAWSIASTNGSPVDTDHPLLAPGPPPAAAARSDDYYIDADARLSPALWLAIALLALRLARRRAAARQDELRPAKRGRWAAGLPSPAHVGVSDVARLAELASAAWRCIEDGTGDSLSSESGKDIVGGSCAADWPTENDVEREALRWAGDLVRRLCTARVEEQVEEARGMDVTQLYDRAEETDDPALRLAIEFLAGERLLLDRVRSQWTFA